MEILLVSFSKRETLGISGTHVLLSLVFKYFSAILVFLLVGTLSTLLPRPVINVPKREFGIPKAEAKWEDPSRFIAKQLRKKKTTAVTETW